MLYWVGQKICLQFSVTFYGKPQMNILVNQCIYFLYVDCLLWPRGRRAASSSSGLDWGGGLLALSLGHF